MHAYIQGFGSGSGKIRCFCLDLDPVFNFFLDPEPGFKFIWIRIWFQPPDPGTQKECRKSSKSYILDENLKIMTNGPSKNEKGNNLIFAIIIK